MNRSTLILIPAIICSVAIGVVAGNWLTNKKSTNEAAVSNTPNADSTSVSDSASKPDAKNQSVIASSTDSDESALAINPTSEKPAEAELSPTQKAEAAYAKGDYETVLAILLPLADADDALAQQRVGHMYKTGTGVDANQDKAVKYLQRALDNGNDSAQAPLVELYYSKLETSTSPQIQTELYQKLAHAGDTKAEAIFGSYLLTGTNVEKDLIQAHTMLTSAAEKGDYTAMSNLGYMYANGAGVPQNHETSHQWYLQSAELGFVRAQTATAMQLEQGLGVEANIQEAIRWYINASSAGDNNASSRLGSLIASGDLVPPSPEDAVPGVMLAAAAGDTAAISWLEDMAKKDSGGAQGALATLYINGSGVPLDTEHGLTLLKQAANNNDSESQLVLAKRLASGDGMEQSPIEAYKWANLAAMNNNQNAVKTRDAFVQLLTPDQLSEAQALSSAWYKKNNELSADQ